MATRTALPLNTVRPIGTFHLRRMAGAIQRQQCRRFAASVPQTRHSCGVGVLASGTIYAHGKAVETWVAVVEWCRWRSKLIAPPVYLIGQNVRSNCSRARYSPPHRNGKCTALSVRQSASAASLPKTFFKWKPVPGGVIACHQPGWNQNGLGMKVGRTKRCRGLPQNRADPPAKPHWHNVVLLEDT